MSLKISTILVLATIFFNSCKEKAANESTKTDPQSVQTTESNTANKAEHDSPSMFKSTVIDANGQKLEMTFDKIKDNVTVYFNNEEIKLTSQQPASGIWYKNDHYELRGKGEEIELTKDGSVIFKK